MQRKTIIILGLATLIILAVGAFAFSSTDLFKGTFGMLDPEEIGLGDDDGIGLPGELPIIIDDDGDEPVLPIPNPVDEEPDYPSCDAGYYCGELQLHVEDRWGDFIPGLFENDFSVTGGPTNIVHSFEETTNMYLLGVSFLQIGDEDLWENFLGYDVTISSNAGWMDKTATDVEAGSIGENGISQSITLNEAHKLRIENRAGEIIREATVTANVDGFSDDCRFYEDNERYFCLLPISINPVEYEVTHPDYITHSGAFVNPRDTSSAPQRDRTVVLDQDTDSDGLTDHSEENTYNSDPNDPDTDGGSVNDGDEITNGTDPNDASDDVPATAGHIFIRVFDKNDEFISGLRKRNFSPDGDGVIVSFTENTSEERYELSMNDTGTYSIALEDAEGYKNKVLENVEAVSNAEDASAIDFELNHLYKVRVQAQDTRGSDDSSDLKEATVSAESEDCTFLSIASRWTDSYGCVLDLDADTAHEFSVVHSGYISQTGLFDLVSDYDSTSVITVTLSLDADNDGISDDDEVTNGTDPDDDDSDDDGLKDGEEVNTHLTDPNKADTDEGTVNDGDEISAGTDPLDASDDVDPLDASDDVEPVEVVEEPDPDPEPVEVVEEPDPDPEPVEVVTVDECKSKFTDIKGHWAEVYVDQLFCREVVSGKTKTKYAGKAPVTKAEAIKILIGNAGHTSSEVSGYKASTYFSDVSSKEWYDEYIGYANDELDILKMAKGSGFDPDGEASRIQVMVWAARIADKTYYDWDGDDIPWKDLSAYDPGAYALLLANATLVDVDGEEKAILEGYKDGTVKPYATISRYEIAAIAYRIARAWYPELLE